MDVNLCDFRSGNHGLDVVTTLIEEAVQQLALPHGQVAGWRHVAEGFKIGWSVNFRITFA